MNFAPAGIFTYGPRAYGGVVDEPLTPMEPDTAKITVAVILGLGALFFGLIPAVLHDLETRRNIILQTILLCFGAGVLLATSLVHMLPEVREDLAQRGLPEIVFCCGFLLVYLADEILHFFCGEAIQHHHPSEYQPILNESVTQSSYGTATSSEHQPQKEETREDHQSIHDIEDEEINARICHTSHVEPCASSFAGIIGLLTALSVHSLLEGLAIGVQDTTQKTLILFVAVISHKLVVAFCLGVELSANPGTTFKRHLLAISVFSAGSALGVLIGMGLVDLNNVLNSQFLPILQGIAGGTLLYVTLCEVLPREKARWHQNHEYKAAGVYQFISFSVGFVVMTLMTMNIKE